MIRTFVSLCTALLAGHLAAQPFLISATRPAVIAGDESDPLARMAMQHLKNYIQQVTGAAPDSVNARSVQFVLETRAIPYFRPDGFQIRTER